MAERAVDATALRTRLRQLLRLHRGGGPWLHGEVARRMAERLLLVRRRPQLIAEWAGALGCSDEVLGRTYPEAGRIVVEPDPEWAEATRRIRRPPWWAARRWRAAGRQTIVTASDALPADSCQLVWANMALHGVVDPPQLLQRWHEMLQVDGFLMFSCFGPDTLRQLRELYAECGWGPPAADFVDMHDLGDMLVHGGFADPVMDQEMLTLTWGAADELLAELRGLGGNVSPARQRGLRTPRWRARLVSALERLRGEDGRLSLTFEVAYGHAFKTAPRQRGGAPATVTLDQMRELARKPRTAGGVG